MGLWDWVAERDRTVSAAGSPEHAAGELVRQWDRRRAGEPRPEPTDPARIYEYFHGGPGTGGYQHIRRTAETCSAALAADADGVHHARAGLAEGWHGDAATAALAALAPLRDRLEALATLLREGADGLTAQLDAFTEARRRVVPAGRAPYCGGLAETDNPVHMLRGGSAAANVGDYQHAAAVNQAAYAAYVAATEPDAGGGHPGDPEPGGHAEPGAQHGSYLVGGEGGDPIVGDLGPVSPPVIGE